MTGPIFDTHAHYSARAFDADRFALLDSLPGKGVVGVCEQATHSGDAPKVLELAHKYPWVYAAVGIHPESLLAPEDCGEEGPAPTVSVYGGDWAAEMRALAPYYEDPKVVAVGECGLDYHWPVPKDAQLALFEAEIRLALAFICGAGYIVWALLMKNNPVSRIAIFGFVNPVVNVLLSALINGEPLFRWQYLGALVLVCIGIWLVNKAPAKKERAL